MREEELKDFINFLVQEGHSDIVIVKPKFWVGIAPYNFTHGILLGYLGNYYGYENRWCYHNYGDALKSLTDWEKSEFKGEPQGWHRHLPSGRRRKNGDSSTEYIRF